MKNKFGVKIYGSRGSIPHCDKNQKKAGGNTSCIQVLHGGPQEIVIDAGTGISNLGDEIIKSGKVNRHIHLFFSHYHWDHISGIPFFSPVYVPGFDICLYGLNADKGCLNEMVDFSFSPAYSPIYSPGNLFANLHYSLKGNGHKIDDVSVGMHQNDSAHPGGIMVYRICNGKDTIIYASDVEMKDRQIFNFLVSTCRDANMLIIDAQFTDDEYGHRMFPAILFYLNSTIQPRILS